MHRPGLTILSGMLVAWVFADAGFAIHPTTVIKKMEKEWNAIDTLRARVIQVYRTQADEVRARYEGSMLIRRPRSLRFDFGPSAPSQVSPATEETFYDFTVFTADGEYLYQYNRVENTLTQDNIRGLNSLPFLKAVAGIENFNEERFNQEFYVVAPVLEERVGSMPVYVLRVRPRPRYEADHQSFDLRVGCEDSLPRRITLYLDQETVDVSIDDLVVNEPIHPDEFNVEIPADADLIPRADQF